MINQLNILDIIIIVILFLSIAFGLIKGLVRELLSMAFFIIAVILSFLFYHDLGNLLSKSIGDKEVSNFTGFIVIFTVVLIIGSIVTYFVKKVFVIGPLKPIDRILGGVFGFLRGILISGVIVFGLIAFPVNDKLILNSQLSPYVMKTINVFYNLLPGKYQEKLKFIKTKQTKQNDRQENR
jgi:membrane protein required for colicin V production